MIHTAWKLYCAFWKHNGNVAALWHMGFGIMFFGSIAMIVWGDRLDRKRDAQREYPENTDHHDY
jgi:4-hydroxybenzoate polyprenyltransferase